MNRNRIAEYTRALDDLPACNFCCNTRQNGWSNFCITFYWHFVEEFSFYGNADEYTWTDGISGAEYCLRPGYFIERIIYHDGVDGACHYVYDRSVARFNQMGIQK